MISLQQGQHLSQQLAPALRQSIKVLAMNLQELRQEIAQEIAANPVIEDVDHPLELPMEAVASRREAREELASYAQPEDEAAPSVNPDEDSAERRQRFFDSQVKTETLQEHLESQIPTSGLPDADFPLAEMLIGNLNDDGYFIGSLPDIEMVTGESEAHVLGVLAAIRRFDPLGCGARNLKECLLAQMEKFDDSPWEDEVRGLIEHHLEDIAAGRESVIRERLNLTHDEYVQALRQLQTLDPRPGRAFESTGEQNRIVKPEVHAVRENGRWIAEVDDLALPDVHISPKYIKMLEDPSVSKEVKDYLRERLAAAHGR